MAFLNIVSDSAIARVQLLSMSNFLAIGFFHLLSTNLKLLSHWMFWIILESILWNAKLLPRAFFTS
jgi:hypothetical protein